MRRMKRKDLLIPVAMLALGAGIGFWTRPLQVDRSTPRADTGDRNEATGAHEHPLQASPATMARRLDPDMSAGKERRPAAIAGAPPATAPASAGLPPTGLPVAEIYPALHERALHGDAVAACRLAFELQRCDRLRPDVDAEMATRIDPGKIQDPQTLAYMERQLAEMADRQAAARDCAGLSDAQRREGFDRLRQAALAGHLPSLLAYAADGGVPSNQTLQRLDQLRHYRNEAMPLLERAMAQGSAAAAMQLSMAYMPSLGFSPLSGLSPGEPDRVVGASLMLYGMQLMRMHPTDQPKDLPTPEELRQVLSMQLGVTDAEMTEAQRQSEVRLAAHRGPVDTRWYANEMTPTPFAAPSDDAPKPRAINDACAQGPWIDLGGVATGGVR
jgi:hypothetical protein